MSDDSHGTTRLAPEHSDLDEAQEPPGDLDARARGWRGSGNPRTLWPLLDPGSLAPAAAAIERSVIAVLDDRQTSLGSANGDDAYAIGIASLLSGTGPLLGYWTERGLLDVSAPLASVLARHLAHGRRRIDRMRREVTPVLTALHRGGVSPRVIKGFHTAHEYFPEPGVRPMADVDVVVAAKDVPRAEEILRATGFVADPGVRRPYKRNWHPVGADQRLWSVELWHHRGAWRLELHDGINFDILTDHGVELEQTDAIPGSWSALGLPLHVVSQPLLFAVLATHLSGELLQMRLIRLIELTLVVRRDRARGLLEWQAVEELFARSRSLRFAYPALALAERLTPGTIDGALLRRARQESTRLTRVVVDQFGPTSPIVPDRVSLAERFMWASNPVEFVRRLALMVSPGRAPSLRAALAAYYARSRRFLTGRVSWRVQPVPPADENPAI
jgi:hypothetical protein